VRFRSLSIRWKLVWITMVITSASLVVAGGGFAAHDLTSLRSSLRERLAIHAGIIGGTSTAALRFHDEEDASETLGALRADAHITAAAIYAHNGQVLARYFRDKEMPLPSAGEGGRRHSRARA
jgi:hypothetical protein